MRFFKRTALVTLIAASAVSTEFASAQPGQPYPNDPNAPSYQDQRGPDRRDDGRGDRWDRDRDRRGDRWDRDGRRRGPSPRRQVGFFYDELSPYGEWVLTRQYGWAWYPNDVPPYWRPYRDGRWTYTDYGWTWASYEPFGWATYHYGRWAWDQRFGWLWVPGKTWGPAWVSWQSGGGYIGWAPLPPEVGYDVGFGIRLGNFSLSVGFEPDNYTFVPERNFLDQRLDNFIVSPSRNAFILRNSQNITRYDNRDSRVMNRGIDVRRIEDVTGRPVRRLRVIDSRSKSNDVGERELRIYRPQSQQLESVEIGESVDQGMRTPPPAPEGWDNDRQPQGRQGDDRDQGDWDVAPRARQPRRYDAAKQEQEERKELQDLQRYQIEEKNRLDRQQQEELGKFKAPNQRQEIEQRHRAEDEALKQEQIKAAEQLKARQQAQREALQAQPADDTGSPPNQR